jgi:myo-inositol-1(or 4)-monophosphatase
MRLEKELNFAKDIAYQAGDIMRKYYRDSDIAKNKPDGSAVTVADISINQLLIDESKKAFPGFGVLGEEQSYESERDNLWICDPIDGTVSYINHVPTSMFSLAYVSDGEPVVGVCYNPWTDDLYYAHKNGGAYRNNEKISVAKHPCSVDKKKLVIGNCQITDEFNGWKKPANIPGYVCPVNGIVFKLCLVAEGSINGQIFEPNHPHDVAGAVCIAKEAGAVVTDLDGNLNQRYDTRTNGCVMSDGLCHDALLRFIADSRCS